MQLAKSSRSCTGNDAGHLFGVFVGLINGWERGQLLSSYDGRLLNCRS